MNRDIITPEVARVLNFLGMLAMIGILFGAYGYQFSYRELPCTLCLLQRVAMVAVAFGAAMNLILGPSPKYYGVCLVSAVFGMIISIRQSMLHINPYFDKATGQPTLNPDANPPFGQEIFGLNLYIWGVLIFGTVFLAVGIVQMFTEQFKTVTEEPAWLTRLAYWGVGLLFVTVAAQTVTTFMECGLGDCPNDGKWNWWIFS